MVNRRHTAVLPAALAVAALTGASLAAAPVASADPGHGVTFYVAPTGDDAAAGDRRHPWASVAHAQDVVQPGDTVVLRGGTYAFDDAVRDCTSQTDNVAVVQLDKSGTAEQPITYEAYRGETPVFDFSGVLDDCRIKGFLVSGSHLVLDGLEVTGVRQNNNLNNESWGIWVTGSYDLFDRIDSHHNAGPGLFIQDGGGNVVRNSDSHDNYDPLSKTGAGQNADGFGSHTDTPTDVENLFEGDRAWNNADDGFDFISSSTPVTVTHSWSWHNGYIYGTDAHAASGNGTGFKLGGYGGKYDPNGVRVTLTYSVAFDNTLRGIYANHHTLADEVYNNTSFDNGANYNMLGIAPDGSPVDLGILRNNVSFGTGGLQEMNGVDSAANSWDLGLQLTAADFLSVSHDGWDAPRQANGDLPDIPNMRPAPGSALLDRGTDLGFAFKGAAPDLGAFEYDPSQLGHLIADLHDIH